MTLKVKYQNHLEMRQDLTRLLYYYIHSRHGSLRRELNVKAPLGAVQNWHELKPELFKITSDEFKNNVLSLQDDLINYSVQYQGNRI